MNKVKKVYVFLVVVFTCLSGIFFYLASSFKIERKLFYEEKGNIDYKVYLKENEYFDEKYLGKDRKYIASLIDYLDIFYKYEFKTNYSMDYKCNYYLLVSSLVKEKNDTGKVIYEKEKYLLENKTKEFKNSKNINLDEKVTINYDEYSKIINDFISKYKLTGTSNTLNLSLCISLEGQSEGFENLVVDKSFLNMSFPLTDQTVDIDVDYKEIDNTGVKREVSNNILFNIIFWCLAGIFALLDILFINLILKSYLKMKKEVSSYEKSKRKIMYQYNRAIAKVDNVIDVKYYGIMEVENFIDLINIRDCLEKPILFMELEKGKLSWFVIIDDKIMYRFVLNEKNSDNII